MIRPGRDRSAIVDPDDDRAQIAQICDLNKAAQRQLRMRRRELEHVVGLTAGRRLAVEQSAVPGCPAYLIGFGRLASTIFGAIRLTVNSCRLGAAPKVLTRTAASIDWVSTRRIRSPLLSD